MANVQAISDRESHAEKLAQLCQHPGWRADKSALEEERFQRIAALLELRKCHSSWVRRPRLYFLLFNLRRTDCMDTFITLGHNDTHLPYRNRRALPRTDRWLFNHDEANEFLSLQQVCLSKVLQLERGGHCHVQYGDTLFEKMPRKLGEGSQGLTTVDEVVSLMTEKRYARKRIARSRYPEAAHKAFDRELRMLKKDLDHLHLIRICGTYSDRRYFALLLLPVADCSLKSYLESRTPKTDAQRVVLFTYFGCMANVMSVLHDQHNVLHKDVKADNFLLKDSRVILTDFGTSHDWSSTDQSSTRSNIHDPVTKRYASPEVMEKGDFHRASDIWSLGVVFLEIMTVLLGRSLHDFEVFMSKEHNGTSHVYANLPGALAWIQELRLQGGHVSEKEPLLWVQQMLADTMPARPDAASIYRIALSAHEAKFCGRCCLDPHSDSASEYSNLSDSDNEDTVKPPIHPVKSQIAPPPLQPPSRAQLPVESTFYDEPVFARGQGPAQFAFRRDLQTRKLGSRDDFCIPHHRAATSSSLTKSVNPLHEKTYPMASSRTQQLSQPHKEQLLKELVRQPQVLKIPTVLSQRIQHYLRNLASPQSGGYIEGFDGSSHEYRMGEPQDTLKYPDVQHPEDVAVTSEGIAHQPGTRLECLKVSITRRQSDGDLSSKYDSAQSDRAALLADLRGFSACLSLPKARQEPACPSTKNESLQCAMSTDDGRNANVFGFCDPQIPYQYRPKKSGEWLPSLHAALPPFKYQSFESATKEHNIELLAITLQLSESHEANVAECHPSQESYAASIGQCETLQEFDTTSMSECCHTLGKSASAAMQRIIAEKEDLAHGYALSLYRTEHRGGNKRLKRAYDEQHGLLPSFIRRGNLAVTLELLESGCNPGISRRPRWLPLFRALEGRTEIHQKCLVALVQAGADVQAREPKTGKTLLHYALSQDIWSGYSTTIYLLLSAGADPNASDSTGTVPLLFFLGRGQPLQLQEREALLLLLAPSFGTRKDVVDRRRNENSLHLAIRQNDPCVLDALLALKDPEAPPLVQNPNFKTKKTKSRTNEGIDNEKYEVHRRQMLQHRNAGGLTPLLLALQMCKSKSGMTSAEASATLDEMSETLVDRSDVHDECSAARITDSTPLLQMLQLLLDNGANPNDQVESSSDTALHIAIGELRDICVLEILIRANADPTLENLECVSACQLLRLRRIEHPFDDFYKAAEQRVKTLEAWQPKSSMKLICAR